MVTISEISTYLPQRIVSNQELLSYLPTKVPFLSPEILKKVFGITERRFAEVDEQVSDLAVRAARPILDRVGKDTIDYLIFASACSDLIEPATCNIVHQKLGLNCPAMDVKNACNSMVSALHTASAFIASGMYNNILIVGGEKLSDAINYGITSADQLKKAISGYSLGDAGAAMLVSSTSDNRGIIFQKFFTAGQHWDLCTILGGGSMHPHDVTKNYFQSDSVKLRDVLIDVAPRFIKDAVSESGWSMDEIDHLITHQVSMQTFEIICEQLDVPASKCISVFEKCGNMASVSVPFALYEGVNTGQINRGDKVALVGLAAGVSVSVQLIIW